MYVEAVSLGALTFTPLSSSPNHRSTIHRIRRLPPRTITIMLFMLQMERRMSSCKAKMEAPRTTNARWFKVTQKERDTQQATSFRFIFIHFSQSLYVHVFFLFVFVTPSVVVIVLLSLHSRHDDNCWRLILLRFVLYSILDLVLFCSSVVIYLLVCARVDLQKQLHSNSHEPILAIVSYLFHVVVFHIRILKYAVQRRD